MTWLPYFLYGAYCKIVLRKRNVNLLLTTTVYNILYVVRRVFLLMRNLCEIDSACLTRRRASVTLACKSVETEKYTFFSHYSHITTSHVLLDEFARKLSSR